MTDRTLGEIVETAMPYSKGGKMRLVHTAYCCTSCNVRSVPGVFVECGVWRGGHPMVARWAAPSRQCWLYDTFDGMTEPGKYDVKRNGEKAIDRYNAKKLDGMKMAACDAHEVRDNLIKENLYDPGLFRFIIGDVRQTLQVEDNLPEQIAVLRLDTDWYDSTRIELEVLYPRLVGGGILIVDDYGHWKGCRKAVNDFLGNKKKYLQPVDYSAVWMVKP